jgi:UPF0755 protein
MRFLGIDFGEKRIGLAVSDADARVATPLTTIERTSDAQAIEQILTVLDEEEIGGIVVGEPRRLDGTRGPAAERAASFARKLEQASGRAVLLVDEALTTHEAQARLDAMPGGRRHQLDAVAAQIILQETLDREAPPAEEGPISTGPAGLEPDETGPAEDPGRGRHRLRAFAVGALALFAVALAVLGLTAMFAWRSLSTPFQGYSGEALELVIEPGRSSREILRQLELEGVLQESFWARLYLSRYLSDPPLKAGEYSFSGALTTPEVLEKLARGEVMTHDVTIIEGLDLEEIAAHLAAEEFGDRDEFLRLLRQADLIRDLDPEAPNLEGYLFPDTYSFARGTSEERVVETMVETFRQHWRETILPLLAGQDEIRPRDLVTLASIVEKETSVDEERATVAGVYTNRLQRGIALYADPTVIYALKLAGTWDGNLRRPDLQFDSPYNTYRYAGLPPGPICSPGLASLRAAAQPAETPYLYFVSRNDGTHVFARTLSEHNRNVERWQRQYWRDRWARERSGQ